MEEYDDFFRHLNSTLSKPQHAYFEFIDANGDYSDDLEEKWTKDGVIEFEYDGEIRVDTADEESEHLERASIIKELKKWLAKKEMRHVIVEVHSSKLEELKVRVGDVGRLVSVVKPLKSTEEKMGHEAGEKSRGKKVKP